MKITLKEWQEESGILATHPTSEQGAVSVTIDQFSKYQQGLWHLSDYVVSSACGIVIWLLPYKQTYYEKLNDLSGGRLVDVKLPINIISDILDSKPLNDHDKEYIFQIVAKQLKN